MLRAVQQGCNLPRDVVNTVLEFHNYIVDGVHSIKIQNRKRAHHIERMVLHKYRLGMVYEDHLMTMNIKTLDLVHNDIEDESTKVQWLALFSCSTRLGETEFDGVVQRWNGPHRWSWCTLQETTWRIKRFQPLLVCDSDGWSRIEKRRGAWYDIQPHKKPALLPIDNITSCERSVGPLSVVCLFDHEHREFIVIAKETVRFALMTVGHEYVHAAWIVTCMTHSFSFIFALVRERRIAEFGDSTLYLVQISIRDHTVRSWKTMDFRRGFCPHIMCLSATGDLVLTDDCYVVTLSSGFIDSTCVSSAWNSQILKSNEHATTFEVLDLSSQDDDNDDEEETRFTMDESYEQ